MSKNKLPSPADTDQKKLREEIQIFQNELEGIEK